MSIYLHGDIHGEPRSLKYLKQLNLTREDYVIVLGDFGMIWDQEETKNEKYWLDYLQNQSWTTLFLDGNHENFARLNAYPIDEWNGGKVQYIRQNIIHLMRGQVYNIDEITFFTMGGASSHDIRDGVLQPDDPRIKEWRYRFDKFFRIDGISWWKEELPSKEEYTEGWKNLEKVNFKVDFILSHSPSTSELILLGSGSYEKDDLTDYLDDVFATVDYKRHYFGHMHINKMINRKSICLYDNTERIS